jgi:6-phosphofructokinase 1
MVKERFGCKVRSIELNLPQRCASHLASATDLDESSGVGEHAFEMAMAGISGAVATIDRVDGEEYAVTYGHHNVSQVANQIKVVPRDFINEEGNGVTEECLRYLLPLIQGERKARYVNGLPYHIRLK